MTVVDPASGFSIYPNLFPRSRMIEVGESLARADLSRSRAGARRILSEPAIRALAEDPAMLSIAREYLGPSAIPYRATLFEKSLSANWLVTWHQDTALPIRQRVDAAGWGPWTTKAGVLHAIAPASALEQVIALRLHLDDSTTENGALRVLPGTHTRGVLNDAQIKEMAHQANAVECLVSAGSVIAMRPLILHASSKARSAHPRRVIHVEYASTLELACGIELAL